MAVTHITGGNNYRMTAAGDQITDAIWIKSIRWNAGAASVADEVLDLVDPTATGDLIWTTVSAGSDYVEQTVYSSPRFFRNGIRIQTMTNNRGDVYVEYA